MKLSVGRNNPKHGLPELQSAAISRPLCFGGMAEAFFLTHLAVAGGQQLSLQW